MSRRRQSLRGRFIFAITMLVAAVLLALAVSFGLNQRQVLIQEIEDHSFSHAALAVGPICDAFETYYTSGFSKFRELVTDISAHNPDLETVEIFDTSGRLLFTSEEFDRPVFQPRAGPGEVSTDPRVLEGVKGLDATSWRATENGRDVFRVVVPYVEEWGRHRYSVAFSASYDSLNSAIRSLAVRLMLPTLGSLLLGAFIAVLLARQSLGPLEQLIAGARDLGEGRLESRLDLRSGDEFEVLARTFNQMAARLSASIADLEASNLALQRSNVELKQLDRLKSDLLANVSHELRTPLTSVQGYAEAIAEGLLGPVSEAQAEALTVAQRNIARLLRMIEELLTYSRLESKRVVLDRQDIDLLELTEQVVGTLRAARGPDINVHVVAAPGLRRVDADALRLTQVLDNLLTNAIKFTPDGGRIEVALRAEDSEVLVEVIDSGIGISEVDRARIFDRFYQVESSSTRSYGGIGLGLAIVKQILDAHGCGIEVESELGRGTTFRFRLPYAREGAPRESARAVLVDDQAAFTREISSVVSRRGYEVRIASSCEAARRQVELDPPDLILLDRLLPDGDGFDLLDEWSRDPRLLRTPIVVISIRKDERLARRLGADDYLNKPFEVEALERALPILDGPRRASDLLMVAGASCSPLFRRVAIEVRRAGVAAEIVDPGACPAALAEPWRLVIVDERAALDPGWEAARAALTEALVSVLVVESGESGADELPRPVLPGVRVLRGESDLGRVATILLAEVSSEEASA